MSPVEISVLLLVAIGAPCVVLVRDPKKQLLVSGVQGAALALLFLVFRAPDVALSELVVSTVALPLMVMLTLSRIRRGQQT